MEEKKYWGNIPILNHFNCFHALSCTKTNDVQSGDGEDKNSSKKRTKGGWKTMPFLLGHESLERLALGGLLANEVVYLKTKYNMEIVTIVNLENIISGTTNLATLGGAFLADAYIGRFLALLIGAFSNLIGTILWTLTDLIPRVRPPKCSEVQAKLRECISASRVQMFFLVMAMVFMSIGSATIRPAATPFGADQFERGGIKTVEQKKDLQSFFNWYFFSMSLVSVVASTVIVYIQSNVSWTLGFGICAILMLISLVGFLIGAPLFYRETPQGSPYTGIAQVIMAAFRKRKLSLPSDLTLLYYGQNSPKISITSRFSFLNKAAIPTEGDMQPDGTVTRPWNLSPIHRIEDLKILIAILPMFSVKICNSITSQQSTYAVFQALTMNRNVGSSSIKVPAASIHVVSSLVVIFWLPLYDKVLVPLTRRLTKQVRGITPLQRMGVGYVFSLISMLVAALVEVKRRNVAKSHGLTDDPSAIAPISVFWLVPQFFIQGLANCFHVVGSLDFFYTEFQPNLRSTAIALSSIMYAVADYLSVFMVTLIHRLTGGNGKPNWLDSNINRGRLDYFYWLLLVMESINALYFMLLAYFYKYRENFVVDGSETSDVSDGQEMVSKNIKI
ncbi:hypothetical protein SUGI_0804820 [Cryptomeria japonica]|nr:hypothetical protein SUGI_0804820 [Cryptomeria japonica]